MTYIVLEGCIKCKYLDCVDVCPVECFHEGENMVVIDPEECIDCGVCVPECPADAIIPDTRDGVPERDKYEKLNKDMSLSWPLITRKADAPEDGDDFKGEEDKFSKYFTLQPGPGDKGRKSPS